MKKIYIMMLLVLTGTMALAQTSVWHGGRQIWTRGAGTGSNPYLIESADNLAFLAYVVNKGYDTEGLYFRLTTDIDLNGSEDLQWVPIGLGDRWFSEDGCDRGTPGNGFSARTNFNGHFDGGEHSISNIFIDDSEGQYGYYVGLFGSVQGKKEGSEVYPAVIENVFVVNGYINCGSCGGIAGSSIYTMFSRCWNGATIEGNSVGGISGSGAYQVFNCYNVGNLSGMYVGGIVGGRSSAWEIVECYNEGDITASSWGGGICSYAKGTTVNNCYNTGSVAGTADPSSWSPAIGGLVGVSQSSCTITNSYNAGVVSSTNSVGCLIGYPTGNIIVENCYYLNTCTESEYGEPKSEDYMRSQEFVDHLNGRNRDQVWAMDVDYINDGFPILVEDNLSVAESSGNTFNVYPNPAQGRFMVEGTGTMTISNVMGQTILTREIDGKETVELPRGMYFVKLGGETRKIVVE